MTCEYLSWVFPKFHLALPSKNFEFNFHYFMSDWVTSKLLTHLLKALMFFRKIKQQYCLGRCGMVSIYQNFGFGTRPLCKYNGWLGLCLNNLEKVPLSYERSKNWREYGAPSNQRLSSSPHTPIDNSTKLKTGLIPNPNPVIYTLVHTNSDHTAAGFQ